jgi:hypothetical protein
MPSSETPNKRATASQLKPTFKDVHYLFEVFRAFEFVASKFHLGAGNSPKPDLDHGLRCRNTKSSPSNFNISSAAVQMALWIRAGDFSPKNQTNKVKK